MEGGELGSDEDGRWTASTLTKIADRSPRNTKTISSVQQELYKCAKKYKDKQTEILLTPGEVCLDTLYCHFKIKMHIAFLFIVIFLQNFILFWYT